jgi:hypothetical protein
MGAQAAKNSVAGALAKIILLAIIMVFLVHSTFLPTSNSLNHVLLFWFLIIINIDQHENQKCNTPFKV